MPIAETLNQFVAISHKIRSGELAFYEEPVFTLDEKTLAAAQKVAESEEKPDNAALIGGDGKQPILLTSHQKESAVVVRHTPLDLGQLEDLQKAQVPTLRIEGNGGK